METRDLEYLLEVERCGGVGKAAEALNMSQPALTKAIKRVEAEVGMPLFMRNPTGVALTTYGKAFIERARRITLEFDDALKELTAIHSGELGVLRVGYSPSIPDTLIMRSCRRLLNERPAAKLHLRRNIAADLFRQINAGELDLAIAPAPTVGIDYFEATRLFDDRLHLMADKNHPLRDKTTVRLKDLLGQEWLLPDSNAAIRQLVWNAFTRQGLPQPSIRVQTDFAIPALLELVRGSRMLCIAGHDPETPHRGIIQLPLADDELDLTRRVCAIHRSGGFISPLATRLIDVLKSGSSAHPTERKVLPPPDSNGGVPATDRRIK
ncbi:LysR family transcriptional regulator [Pandoraea thiooxydans]|uniref:LysR family transcriptional regulator n=1 Tax=Pandoraea thiooxydans TaxID=445709 RepID=UPI000932A274|nr:LysR family transcriptional regulator [Pandoraea thiooxydans]APD30429.1 LysR family transcriptional regulator [Pandoraea thiooxydans]APR95788.1 LysR family transcriptional regulator [Pandoraea thiooxydans]